jgi:secondary thiamine-phosphate synthase enzyme
MTVLHHWLEIHTQRPLELLDLTSQVRSLVAQTGIRNGQVVVFNRHTTTALAVNEYETRLLDDIQNYLRRLAPSNGTYLHNDLDKRSNIPADEPRNAHAHLLAISLHNSECIPIVESHLGLGTYQSILLIELDGPRKRQVLIQLSGERSEPTILSQSPQELD